MTIVLKCFWFCEKISLPFMSDLLAAPCRIRLTQKTLLSGGSLHYKVSALAVSGCCMKLFNATAWLNLKEPDYTVLINVDVKKF